MPRALAGTFREELPPAAASVSVGWQSRSYARVESVEDSAVTGPSCEEKSVEDRLAGRVGSRSSGRLGVSGRSLGGAADHALRSPRTSAVEGVDAGEDGVDERPAAAAALGAQRAC